MRCHVLTTTIVMFTVYSVLRFRFACEVAVVCAIVKLDAYSDVACMSGLVGGNPSNNCSISTTCHINRNRKLFRLSMNIVSHISC
jgi:hypothetical protein